MDKAELKLIIGEIVLEHFERSSNEGDFPDEAPQEFQQQLFDEFVNNAYEAFLANPHWVENLHLADKDDIKGYLNEKLKKYRGY